jgi:hypothetical protein
MEAETDLSDNHLLLKLDLQTLEAVAVVRATTIQVVNSQVALEVLV